LKSLIVLWTVLLQDLGEWCHTSTSRDIEKAAVRFEHEGLSFLTITLPAFCRDLEKGLEDGFVGPDLFAGFKRRGRLPRFLGEFMDLVFDRGTGCLLRDPSVDSVQAMRQITLLYSKVLVECSDARKQAAIDGYLQCETEIKRHDRIRSSTLQLFGRSVRATGALHNQVLVPQGRSAEGICNTLSTQRTAGNGSSGGQLPSRRTYGLGNGCSAPLVPDLSGLERISCLLFRDALAEMDRLCYDGNLYGKHGPGATADGLRGNSKFDLTEWPFRLQLEFPYWEHAVASPRFVECEQPGRIDLLLPGDERPVKVVLVPKTLKTPRVIAEEPTAMMFMQQALAEPLTDLLERPVLATQTPGDYPNQRVWQPHRGMIGFRNQAPNQELAKKGSLEGNLATLDLSEASDRVSNQHVLAMFARFPHFSRAVQACRSRKADVLHMDGSLQRIRLSKFASMGSALTFPVEAMVFLSMVFLGIESVVKHPLTRRDVRSFAGQVRVYGDDIIVPVEFVPSVIAIEG
jgi:hypothetical protein